MVRLGYSSRLELRGLRGFQGLGQVDLTQFNLAQNLLQQANTLLQSMEALYAGNPAALEDLGPPLTDLQTSFQNLQQAYVYAYTTATGAPPPTNLFGLGRRGMRGLGQWQVSVPSGAPIGAVVSGLRTLLAYISGWQGIAQTAIRYWYRTMSANTRGLGQIPPYSLPTGTSTPLGVPESALPGTSWQNYVFGTLSSDQIAQLEQQEAAALVQAGASPADAQSQAASDVTSAVGAASAAPTEISWGWLAAGAAALYLIFQGLK